MRLLVTFFFCVNLNYFQSEALVIVFSLTTCKHRVLISEKNVWATNSIKIQIIHVYYLTGKHVKCNT